jgi:hypothetical protein
MARRARRRASLVALQLGRVHGLVVHGLDGEEPGLKVRKSSVMTWVRSRAAQTQRVVKCIGAAAMSVRPCLGASSSARSWSPWRMRDLVLGVAAGSSPSVGGRSGR